MDAANVIKPGTFSLPLMNDGDERNGLLVHRSEECSRCSHRNCETAKPTQTIELCCEGVNFVPVAPRVLIRGIFVSDWEPAPNIDKALRKHFRKQRRHSPQSLVDSNTVTRHVEGLRHLIEQDRVAAGVREQQDFSSQYTKRIFEDWARQVVANATGSLSPVLVHDLLQLLATIFQNIEYVLAQRYGDAQRATGRSFPGIQTTPAAQIEKVWQKEKAILFTCELMSERLNASRLLAGDDTVTEGALIYYSPHRLFTKLCRMYEALAQDRGLSFELGSSWDQCLTSDGTAEIAALGILDNAVKYAPDRSTIRISFVHDERSFRVVVESLGPKIEKDEIELIFTPGYRGRHAKTRKPGSGLGLWQAALAIRRWGELHVDQETVENQKVRGMFVTRFQLVHLCGWVAGTRTSTPGL